MIPANCPGAQAAPLGFATQGPSGTLRKLQTRLHLLVGGAKPQSPCWNIKAESGHESKHTLSRVRIGLTPAWHPVHRPRNEAVLGSAEFASGEVGLQLKIVWAGHLNPCEIGDLAHWEVVVVIRRDDGQTGRSIVETDVLLARIPS